MQPRCYLTCETKHAGASQTLPFDGRGRKLLYLSKQLRCQRVRGADGVRGQSQQLLELILGQFRRILLIFRPQKNETLNVGKVFRHARL